MERRLQTMAAAESDEFNRLKKIEEPGSSRPQKPRLGKRTGAIRARDDFGQIGGAFQN